MLSRGGGCCWEGLSCFAPFFLLSFPFNSVSSCDPSYRVRQIVILNASKWNSFSGFCSLWSLVLQSQSPANIVTLCGAFGKFPDFDGLWINCSSRSVLAEAVVLEECNGICESCSLVFRPNDEDVYNPFPWSSASIPRPTTEVPAAAWRLWAAARIYCIHELLHLFHLASTTNICTRIQIRNAKLQFRDHWMNRSLNYHKNFYYLTCWI